MTPINTFRRSTGAHRGMAVALFLTAGACASEDHLPEVSNDAPNEVVDTSQAQAIEWLPVASFEASFDPAVGEFTIEMLDLSEWDAADAALYRQAEQSLFCPTRITNGARDTVVLSTDPGTIFSTVTDCGLPAEFPYTTLGAFCAEVSARPVGFAMTEVYAQITSMTPNVGYNGYRFPFGTGVDPLTITASLSQPSDAAGGLFAYGDIAENATVPSQWVFENAGGAFNFRGRVVSRFVETLNGFDDDCDGRIDNATNTYVDGTACTEDADCVSNICANDICTDTRTLVIFDDDYAPDVAFAEFGGSVNVLTVDETEAAVGTASLRIDVPETGTYTGGALVVASPEDLSYYNALTFWAKASEARVLNTAGIGNDGASNFYQLEIQNIPLTTDWVQYTIPTVSPDRLTDIAGLFHFAEGAEGVEYSIWLDDIQYSILPPGVLGTPTGAFATLSVTIDQDTSTDIIGQNAATTVNGDPLNLFPMPIYYDWISSDDAIATVSPSGVITGEAPGTAVITGEIAGTPLGGAMTIDVAAIGGPTAPTDPAPTPTTPIGDVVATIFSDAYPADTVDTFLTPWSAATGGTTIDVMGDAVLQYDNVDFLGVEFLGVNALDITAATHVHFDIWSPNATRFGFQPTDFGADNAFGGGDDSNGQVSITAGSTPSLTTGTWLSYDIPMSEFEALGLTSRANLSQLILVGRTGVDTPGVATIFIDNIYFYTGAVAPPATEPTVAAPTPTTPPGDVVAAIFSDAYTEVTVDTFLTPWSGAASGSVVDVAGNNTLHYTGLDFAGVEFVGPNSLDISAATHVHFDVWSPNATQIGFQPTDWGADNSFDGGDDSNGQVTIDATSTPALATGEWLSYDIPMSEFEALGLTSRANLSQLILVGRVGAPPVPGASIFFDNIYFYTDVVAPTAPTVAAPTPTTPPGNVVAAIFSDAYTEVTLDTLFTPWSGFGSGNVVSIAGDDTIEYTGLDFAGIEFAGANSLDVSAATHVHFDVWSPDATMVGFQPVDFGANNAFGGGDDSQHQVQLTSASTPALTTGTWISYDIPMTDFTGAGLLSTTHLSQLVLVGRILDPQVPGAKVYVDNIYFYN